MLPKPPQFAPEYGAQFKDRSVAQAYPHRPPYPAETFAALASLAVDTPRAVLDVGAGTGDIARRLAPLVDRLDAVDFSAAMIAQGRRQPGGDHPNLNWIHAPVEEAPLAPPYALITAGESLHWLAWEVVFPRFADVLTARGALALVGRDWDGPPAVRDRLGPIFGRYSTNRDYRPYNLIAELELRGLFRPEGERRVGPEPWRPTIDEYIECRHSQNGLSRERMGRQADAFDAALRAALLDLCREGALTLRGGRLELTVEAKITWGRPHRP